MLPIIEAFANGDSVEVKDLYGSWKALNESPNFNCDLDQYRIAKPKERVPLEAEDWIKDGPWWIKGPRSNGSAIVSTIGECGVMFIDSSSKERTLLWRETMECQRRNATSDWMPCWKEKE